VPTKRLDSGRSSNLQNGDYKPLSKYSFWVLLTDRMRLITSLVLGDIVLFVQPVLWNTRPVQQVVNVEECVEACYIFRRLITVHQRCRETCPQYAENDRLARVLTYFKYMYYNTYLILNTIQYLYLKYMYFKYTYFVLYLKKILKYTKYNSQIHVFKIRTEYSYLFN